MPAIDAFLRHLRASCDDGSFVRLSLTAPTERAGQLERVLVRLVALRGERHLSFTLRERRRDTTANLPLVEGVDDVGRRLRTEFRGALLATTAADWQLQQTAGGEAKLIRHRASSAEAPPRAHDNAKATLLDERARPWLQGLGIVDALGRPRRNLAGKHAQIERYAEILGHLARDCGWHDAAADVAPLHVVDVGCGVGHLTFAAWHLVKHVLRREPRVVGVEARAELVAGANGLAREVACDGLSFVCGDIGDAPLPAVDALIALHACNTATDHAIRRGVMAGARLVVVAPCCHQEVRPQLAAPEPLAPALRHGLLAERMAEWATDALRALVLEWAGYRTKVIEFVSSEHTAKNTMLAAVRTAAPPAPAARAAARDAIERLRAFFGIGHCALDELLAAAPPAG